MIIDCDEILFCIVLYRSECFVHGHKDLIFKGKIVSLNVLFLFVFVECRVWFVVISGWETGVGGEVNEEILGRERGRIFQSGTDVSRGVKLEGGVECRIHRASYSESLKLRYRVRHSTEYIDTVYLEVQFTVQGLLFPLSRRLPEYCSPLEATL
jgi:hypothetical protein